MCEMNMKNMFLEAINSGRVRAIAVNKKINSVINVIKEADSAINSIYPKAEIKFRVNDMDIISAISVYVSVGDELVTRRVMDIEINKSDIDNFYVSWKEGKVPISSVEEFAELLSYILSSPTFLISIENMISSAS